MTLIVSIDPKIDLWGTLNYVHRLEHDRNNKNKKNHGNRFISL